MLEAVGLELHRRFLGGDEKDLGGLGDLAGFLQYPFH
jgi:hypothetical protein